MNERTPGRGNSPSPPSRSPLSRRDSAPVPAGDINFRCRSRRWDRTGTLRTPRADPPAPGGVTTRHRDTPGTSAARYRHRPELLSPVPVTPGGLGDVGGGRFAPVPGTPRGEFPSLRYRASRTGTVPVEGGGPGGLLRVPGDDLGSYRRDRGSSRTPGDPGGPAAGSGEVTGGPDRDRGRGGGGPGRSPRGPGRSSGVPGGHREKPGDHRGSQEIIGGPGRSLGVPGGHRESQEVTGGSPGDAPEGAGGVSGIPGGSRGVSHFGEGSRGWGGGGGGGGFPISLPDGSGPF